MEIPTWLFFSFWALISTIFLHLSLHALDKAHLHTSVSPLFMLFLKHSLAISSSSSSAYALKYRPQSTHHSPSSSLFVFYAILSSFLATTTDGILLRATFITFYSRLLHFLLHFKSLLVPILPNLLHLWKIAMKVVLGIEVAKYAWLVLSLRGEIFFIAYSLLEKGSLSLFHLIVKLVWIVLSLQWLCCLPAFFAGFLRFVFLVSLRLSWQFLVFSVETVLIFGTGEDEDGSTAETRGRVAVLMVMEVSLFFVSVDKTGFSPIAVVLLSHLISAVWAAASRFGEEEGGTWIEYLARAKESRTRKVIEFGVGAAGAVFFRRMSLALAFALWSRYEAAAVLLCLGVMWLANLTLLGFPFDFGVFYFVVGSGVVMGWSSWMLCGVALLLVGLRLKLESVALVYDEDDHIQMAVFGY